MKKIQEWGGVLLTALIMSVNIGLLYGQLSKNIETIEANVQKNEVRIEEVSHKFAAMREDMFVLRTEIAKMDTKIDFIIKKLEEK